jgi:hypothetical protein
MLKHSVKFQKETGGAGISLEICLGSVGGFVSGFAAEQ